MAQLNVPGLRGYQAAQENALRQGAAEDQALGSQLQMAGGIMQLQDAFRKRAEDDQLKELFRSSGGDLGKMRDSAFSAGMYKQGLELDKALREQQKQDLERRNLLSQIDERKRKVMESQNDAIGGAYAHPYTVYRSLVDKGVPEQMARTQANAAWQATRSQLMQNPIFETVPNLPETFDPDQALGTLHTTKRAKDIFDLFHKEETLGETKRANRARETETARHNRVSEGISAGQLGVARQRLDMERSRDQRPDLSQPFEVTAPDGRQVLAQQDKRTGLLYDVNTKAPLFGVAPRMDASAEKELRTIDQMERLIGGAISAVRANPGAFGFERGLATLSGTIPESLRGRMDTPEEQSARAFLFNNVSAVINERAGAAQSRQELARLRTFLPSETDSPDQVVGKLQGFQDYLKEKRSSFQQPLSPQSTQPREPSIDKKTGKPTRGAESYLNAVRSGG